LSFNFFSTTLKKKKEFEALYSEGSRFDCGCLLFIWRFNKSNMFRAGYPVSKKVGNACRRNLIKRWLKNSLAALLNELRAGEGDINLKGVDFIVRVRPEVLKRGYHAVYHKLAGFIKSTALRQDREVASF
jgi:ribonuclease P protein component